MYLIYFNNCQKLGILNGQTIDINTDILKTYIKRLDILKHNYKYNKTLIQLYNKTYEIDEDNYFFCRNRYINFTASNNINGIIFSNGSVEFTRSIFNTNTPQYPQLVLENKLASDSWDKYIDNLRKIIKG